MSGLCQSTMPARLAWRAEVRLVRIWMMKNEMRPKPRDGRVMMVNTDSCSVLEPTLCKVSISERKLVAKVNPRAATGSDIFRDVSTC